MLLELTNSDAQFLCELFRERIDRNTKSISHIEEQGIGRRYALKRGFVSGSEVIGECKLQNNILRRLISAIYKQGDSTQ